MSYPPVEVELKPAVLGYFRALLTGNKASQDRELHIKTTHACQKTQSRGRNATAGHQAEDEGSGRPIPWEPTAGH